DVAMTVAPTFAGVFTVAGIVGSVLSIYLYAVGRRYIGEGGVGHVRESFESAYDTFQHAAMETSFVTVWVIGGYLLYEYVVLFGSVDIAAAAAAAGLLAPVGGALVGLIPGCGPQIVLAGVYAEGAVPFSALTANAISQDGDALFPLIAMDKTAAIVASIYTTIPALVVGIALHAAFGPLFGFGVL
ncbi:MAG: putative manganese transporter, partial [Halalkalicoccus sp.]|nr:putative manganese transporter [Halalkalicoccus sp.]